jgi:hypothetical protein
MKSFLHRPGVIWWATALLLALAFLAIDSALRLRTVHNLARVNIGTQATDTLRSQAGVGVHRIILQGADSYHWIMQTEQMLADGSLRTRSTPRDNAPAGRDVHWSASMRWWLAAVARG